jgi:hypothetical protein
MKTNEAFFIRTKGKGDFKTYHLINVETFELLDIFFDSEGNAKQYAAKHSLNIVEYKESFETENDGE